MPEALSPVPPSSGASVRAMRAVRVAVVGLVVTNVFWGWSFPALKVGLLRVEEIVPQAGELAVRAAFMGVRFLAAAALYALVAWRSMRGFARDEVLGGGLIGVALGLGMLVQLLGLRYVHPSTSGFLTSLVVVFVPVAQALVLRRMPGRLTWLAVALALGGSVALSSGGASAADVAAAPFPYFGELLTAGAALIFAVQILLVDRYGRGCDTQRLTVVMFLATGAVNLALGPLFGGFFDLFAADALRRMAGDWTIQWTVSSTIVFCTVASFHLMNKYQPFVTPAKAGVIYCLEPIFATLFSVWLAFEEPRKALLGGGLLILCGLGLVVWEGLQDAKRAAGEEPEPLGADARKQISPG